MTDNRQLTNEEIEEIEEKSLEEMEERFHNSLMWKQQEEDFKNTDSIEDYNDLQKY